MSSITVLFLGPAKDFVGTARSELSMPDGGSILELRERLVSMHPRLSTTIEAMRFAINGVFARDAEIVRVGDEVAIIPPVSGG